MTGETPLFDAALAGLGVTAYYRYPDGWRLRVTQRQDGDVMWSVSDEYESLATAEMLDVLAAVVDGLVDRWGSSSS